MARVLALVTEAYGSGGGIAQATRDLIGSLAADDIFDAVDVLPRLANAPEGELPPKVTQESAISGRLRYSMRALVRAVSNPPAVVFCNHLYMAPLAHVVARAARSKLVVQLHGIEVWQEPSVFQRRALEAANLLICVSRHTRARVLDHVCVAPERVIVLNNAVGPQFFPADRNGARVKFGLQNEFALLTVGRLDARERYKGHDKVIASLPNLELSVDRPVCYLIAGDGDDRARLETLARSLGVSARVTFLGKVTAGDLPDLYRAADLFCMPSSGEGFGIVFIESMACGTPAIGLDAGGAADALGDGELGQLVAPGADFADALFQQIQMQPPDAAVLAAAARARFGIDPFKTRTQRAFRMLTIAQAQRQS